MASTYGTHLRVTLFGTSHGPEIGVDIDGLPAGEAVDLHELDTFLGRRRAAGRAYATRRREPDLPEFQSGLTPDGHTDGSRLHAIIRNTDTRSRDYRELADLPRPSHADFTAYAKHYPPEMMAGGGPFSGRLTAPLCIAGGIAKQILARRGVTVCAHALRIAGISDIPFDPLSVGPDDAARLEAQDFPTLSAQVGEQMQQAIAEAAADRDSVGGIVECAVTGLAPGSCGDALFDGLEGRISLAVFAIPAVKGIAFGAGFESADLRGSENNDPFRMQNGRVVTETNRHGGILGGIASGMPVLFRAAFKPTPSIFREQKTVSLSRRENATLTLTGRHDPCIVPRAVPAVEAAAAIAVLDALLAG